MEEVEGKRKKRTRQRAKAGAVLGSEAALADEDQDDRDDDDDADSASLPPPSPTKRKKRVATVGKSTPVTKGRRKPTKKSSAKARLAESADEVIQLGESFDFSSDLGPEDDDDDDVDRTRAREDLDIDFSDGDEATDDEPGDAERSFARLEAAQDALDFARDELLRDDFHDGDDGDDDIRADVEPGDDIDESDILPAALLAETISISSKAPTKKTASSRRGGSSRGIAKLSDSFAATKPAQTRTAGAKKRSTSASLSPDDSDGLSPLAVPTGKSGKTAGKGRSNSQKAPPAYIEISD